MGEFSESDCSWKKIVISKNNEKWVSNRKHEDDEVSETASSIPDFTSGDDQGLATNIKLEPGVNLSYGGELNVTQSYQCSDEPGVFEPHLTLSEIDPLDETGSYPDYKVRRGDGLKNETPEARALRLTRMSAYAAQRIANESPEQRALRLKRMSEYAARRLAKETPEQRAKRLARMSEYAARRIANETPEQRKARLKRMSEYAAKRHARKKITLDSPGSSDSSPNFMSSLGLRSRFVGQCSPTKTLVINETEEESGS